MSSELPSAQPKADDDQEGDIVVTGRKPIAISLLAIKFDLASLLSSSCRIAKVLGAADNAHGAFETAVEVGSGAARTLLTPVGFTLQATAAAARGVNSFAQGDRMEAVWAQAMLPFIGSMAGTAAGVAVGTAAGGSVTKHPWGAMGGALIGGITGNYVGEGIGQEAADAISGRAGGGGC